MWEEDEVAELRMLGMDKVDLLNRKAALVAIAFLLKLYLIV